MNIPSNETIDTPKEDTAEKQVTIKSTKNSCYWTTTGTSSLILASARDDKNIFSRFLINDDQTICGYDPFANTYYCVFDENDALILSSKNYSGNIPTFTLQSINDDTRFLINGEDGACLGLFPGARIKKSTTLDDSTLWLVTSNQL